MRFAIVILLLVGLCSRTYPQDHNLIDSLKTELLKGTDDTTRIFILNELGWELQFTNPDTAILLSNEALELCDKLTKQGSVAKADIQRRQAISYSYLAVFNKMKGDNSRALEYNFKALRIVEVLNNEKKIAVALGNIGTVYKNLGDYSEALKYYFRALKIDERLDNKKAIARHLGNLGVVYKNQGDYPKGLSYFFKALKINEEMEYKRGIAFQLGYIAGIYWNQGDYPKALEYLLGGLKILEEEGDKYGISIQLGNIGIIHWIRGDYPEALEFFFRGLEVADEMGDKDGIATMLGNIGLVYNRQADTLLSRGADKPRSDSLYNMTMEYYFKALRICEEIGDKRSESINLANIGALYVQQKRYQEAEAILMRALRIDSSMDNLGHIKVTTLELSKLYEQIGDYHKAYKFYQTYSVAKDSIFNEAKSKDLGKLEAKHEFETAELERKREEKVLAQEEAEAKSRRDNLQYSGILIFLVLMFAAVFMLGKFTIPIRLAEGMIFFSFLLFFEFTLVLLDPYIETYSSGAPAIKLGFNAVLAGLIFPLHSIFESQVKKRLISS